MHWTLRVLITAAATAVAAWLLPGIHVIGDSMVAQIISLLVAALIFGAVNTVVKPLFQTFGACLIVVTLGLFLLVINALMLMLTSWLSKGIGAGFTVDGFWWAVLGSIIISFVSSVLVALVPQRRQTVR